MNSSLYDVLVSKIKNPNKKNDIFGIDLYNSDSISINSITYLELLNMVNNYINDFSKLELSHGVKFLIIDSTFKSIAMFIALLTCHIVPVLIDKNKINKIINDIEGIDIENNDLSEDSIIIVDKIWLQSFSDSSKKVRFALKEYLSSIHGDLNFVNMDVDNDNKFIITTSGTLGPAKFVLIKEKEIIDKISNDFDLNEKMIFYNTTSISSISGMIYNVILPIIGNNIQVYTDSFSFENIFFTKPTHIFLPRNFNDFLNKNLKNYDFSFIKKIYLAGEINSGEIINTMRNFIPSLNKNVFVNMYGTTENKGIISSCNENEMKKIYIYSLSLDNNEIIYSYDKEKIYRMLKGNISIINDSSFYKYNKNIFLECLPVSSDKTIDVNISNDSLGKIVVNNVDTGDIGCIINNNLYIICRYNELINIDGISYFLPAFDEIFTKLTNLQAVSFKTDLNKVYVAINYKLDRKSISNFKKIISLVLKCKNFLKEFSLPVEDIIFIESSQFPRSETLKKYKRNELVKFIEYQNDFNYSIYNYTNSFLEKVKDSFVKLTGKIPNISINNNVFEIKKNKYITIEDIIILIKKYKVTYLEEKKDCFKIWISDDALFNCYSFYNDWSDMHFQQLISDYTEKYKNGIFFESFFEKLPSICHSNNLELPNAQDVCLLTFEGIFKSSGSYIMFCPMKVSINEIWSLPEGEIFNYSLFDDIPNDFEWKEMSIPFFDYNYYMDTYIDKILTNYECFLNHKYVIDNNEYYMDDKKTIERKYLYFLKWLSFVSKADTNNYGYLKRK